MKNGMQCSQTSAEDKKAATPTPTTNRAITPSTLVPTAKTHATNHNTAKPSTNVSQTVHAGPALTFCATAVTTQLRPTVPWTLDPSSGMSRSGQVGTLAVGVKRYFRGSMIWPRRYHVDRYHSDPFRFGFGFGFGFSYS